MENEVDFQRTVCACVVDRVGKMNTGEVCDCDKLDYRLVAGISPEQPENKQEKK